MATLQESQDEQLLGNQRDMLADKEQLVISLNAELSDILTKERAGNRILEEIADLAKGHAQDVVISDRRRAEETLRKLGAKRTVLEFRIHAAKTRIESLRVDISRHDQPKFARLERIRNLFQTLAG